MTMVYCYHYLHLYLYLKVAKFLLALVLHAFREATIAYLALQFLLI